ncbi:MAG TPA: CoA pyrophosphatase [Bacteroidia bacterium]|jgi:8-oxo-dGTP pyrophosphatase MutT (NUDIX family)|nr:CoA pyrophosphatase [Bacteroidia bacterium]
MFLEFIDILTDEIGHGLPGWEAQKMMISGRPKMDLELIAKKNPRQSSVLVWLYPESEEIFTRLILRTEYKGVHSAQVAFPGGTKEETDTNLWQTALREAHEEVGLLPEKIKYVGELSPVYIPPSNFWVQPYIGMSEEKMPSIVQNTEVQYSIDVNIRLLIDPKIKEEKLILRSGSDTEMKTPYYNIEGHTVWGATAMMLSELEELLRRVYKRMG